MVQKYLKFLLKCFAILLVLSVVELKRARKNQKLPNFICSIVKDQLKKHPETRTIALIELENNFPVDFGQKILECFPSDVAKLLLKPKKPIECDVESCFQHTWLTLPKETMIIYAVDNEVKNCMDIK